MDASGMSEAPTSPRPRSRGFSFTSNRSNGSKPARESLTESPQEKARRDKIWQGSKANPNAALIESQPAVANLLEETTIQTLRGVQHKDTQGNVITDPDLSNPTRPRLERPLDTIRSFEKAIDNGYRRRTSYQRAESYDQQAQSGHSRRSSYMGNNGHDNQNRQSHGGYYAQPNNAGPARMRSGPGPRQQSDPMLYSSRGASHHPQHGAHASQDTTHTFANSDTTGPWASGTDPSSENSSIDRISNGKESMYGPPPPQHGNGYGPNGGYPGPPSANGFQGSIPEEGGAYPIPHGSRNSMGPAAATRAPISLGNSVAPNSQLPPSAPRPAPVEKRKSWLKRRFSKQ